MAKKRFKNVCEDCPRKTGCLFGGKGMVTCGIIEKENSEPPKENAILKAMLTAKEQYEEIRRGNTDG